MLLCKRDQGMFLVSRWVVLLFSCWLSFVDLSICKQSNPQATQHEKCPHSQALRGCGLGMKLGMTWVWGHCFVSLYRHLEYIVEGTMYMRMKFYVDGSKRKGVVHLDLKKVTKHLVLAINKRCDERKVKDWQSLMLYRSPGCQPHPSILFFCLVCLLIADAQSRHHMNRSILTVGY